MSGGSLAHMLLTRIDERPGYWTREGLLLRYHHLEARDIHDAIFSLKVEGLVCGRRYGRLSPTAMAKPALLGVR